MLRSLLGVIAGILVGGFVVLLLELPGMVLYPLPPGLDWDDSQAIANHMANAPTSLKVMVVVAWAVGPFCAALATCCIVRRGYFSHALVIGCIFVLLDLVNLARIPSPWWMWVGGLAAPPLTALLGARFAQLLWPPANTGPRVNDMREKNMAC